MARYLAGFIESSSHGSKQPVTPMAPQTENPQLSLTALDRWYRSYLSLTSFRQALREEVFSSVVTLTEKKRNTQAPYGPCFTVRALNLFVGFVFYMHQFTESSPLRPPQYLTLKSVGIQHRGELHSASWSGNSLKKCSSKSLNQFLT